jgi:hypothetical protein
VQNYPVRLVFAFEHLNEVFMVDLIPSCPQSSRVSRQRVWDIRFSIIKPWCSGYPQLPLHVEHLMPILTSSKTRPRRIISTSQIHIGPRRLQNSSNNGPPLPWLHTPDTPFRPQKRPHILVQTFVPAPLTLAGPIAQKWPTVPLMSTSQKYKGTPNTSAPLLRWID